MRVWTSLSAALLLSGCPDPELPDVVDVEAAIGGTCARNRAGEIRCFGLRNDPLYAGALDAPADSGFVQFSLGLNHGCGVKGTGEVRCWGGSTDAANPFDPTPPTGLRAAWVSAGSNLSCAVDLDGFVRCWSDANGFFLESSEGNFRRVVSADLFICAHHADGTAECWTYEPDTGDAPSFRTVERFRSLEHGPVSFCAHREDAQADCLASNNAGEVPDLILSLSRSGTLNGPDGRAEASTLPRYERLFAGPLYNCGYTAQEFVCSDGRARYDAIGLDEEFYADLALGVIHGCGITEDGRLLCRCFDLGDQLRCADELIEVSDDLFD